MHNQGIDEYDQVFRVDCLTREPPGYRIMEAKTPYTAHTWQYARDMTRARGRILYEIWDFQQNKHLGYIVPERIFIEAMIHRTGASLHSWHHLSPSKTKAHHCAHAMLLKHFPRIAPISAKMIVERLHYYHSKSNDSWEVLEPLVVEHVLHLWTSYALRIHDGTSTAAEALQAVKPRMRDVLRSWLPLDIPESEIVRLWRKYELLDETESGG